MIVFREVSIAECVWGHGDNLNEASENCEPSGTSED